VRLRECALSLLAGALLTCAFAPLNLWGLAILSPAILMWLWEGSTPRRAALTGFCFNATTFACGTSWMYIGVHDYSGAPVWIALGLVIGLTGIMAAYHALLGYLSNRVIPAEGAWRWLVGLPALWTLIEWLRGWFCSGFPWLALGYSQTDTWLSGFAPIIGVYGISALLLVGSGALVALVRGRGRVRITAAIALLLPWPVGLALQRIQWTHPSGPHISVAVLQGAVPEDLKWQTDNVEPTRTL
jgi:apolipoprotein N-acyltransferase